MIFVIPALALHHLHTLYIDITHLNNTKDDAGTSPGVKYLTVLPCLEAQG